MESHLQVVIWHERFDKHFHQTYSNKFHGTQGLAQKCQAARQTKPFRAAKEKLEDRKLHIGKICNLHVACMYIDIIYIYIIYSV